VAHSGNIRICIGHASDTCSTMITILYTAVTIAYYNIQDVGIYYNRLLFADL